MNNFQFCIAHALRDFDKRNHIDTLRKTSKA